MLNKVILMGRLTRDPEFRQTTSGVPVCRFSIGIFFLTQWYSSIFCS